IEHLAARLAVEVESELCPRMRGDRSDRLAECGFLARAHAIVKLEGPAQRDEALDHAPQRRDADAAGDEERMRRVLGERKIVARAGDRDHRADAQTVMHPGGAAAARAVALHRDQVAMPL